MDPLELARWQFGVTTVYHFLFVPLTISLAFIVAGFQTAWYRTGHDRWLRLTKFYGKLFLINFAMGVVTGIVQEFQFGMNWSSYSRFVGDIFGAPLAVEGLVAFFLESTFLGLWIFGWDRLPRRLHLATIWLAATGTLLSAYFILAANSWMQNPVGYTVNAERGRAELTDFAAVLTNKVVLVTFPHTITAAFMTGAAFVAGVALWHLRRHRDVAPDLARDVAPDGASDVAPDVARAARDRAAFVSAARVGAVTLVVAALGVVVTGDAQGKVMTEVQPMKMAAAEALYETAQPAPFSILTVGTLDGSEPLVEVQIPNLLSYLATGDWDGEVRGINDLQAEYEQQFGQFAVGSFAPNIPVTYWSFRLMIGTGAVAALIGVWILWSLRGNRQVPSNRWVTWAAIGLPLLPLAANSFGWIFTEMGRQPWVVFGLMQTGSGVSPSVGAATVALSLVGFTVVYGLLAVVEVGLVVRYVRAGLPPQVEVVDDEHLDDPHRPLVVAY